MPTAAIDQTRYISGTVKRNCDQCGQPFTSKNAAAARAMLAGKLLVCDTCRRAGHAVGEIIIARIRLQRKGANERDVAEDEDEQC